MAQSPTDQSKAFVESGKRLITSPSSDALLEKARVKKKETKSGKTSNT